MEKQIFWCVYIFDHRAVEKDFEIAAIYSIKADAEKHIREMAPIDGVFVVEQPVTRSLEDVKDEFTRQRLNGLGLRLAILDEKADAA